MMSRLLWTVLTAFSLNLTSPLAETGVWKSTEGPNSNLGISSMFLTEQYAFAGTDDGSVYRSPIQSGKWEYGFSIPKTSKWIYSKKITQFATIDSVIFVLVGVRFDASLFDCFSPMCSDPTFNEFGIFRSTNFGKTWQKKITGNITGLTIVGKQIFAAKNGGSILRSKNFGENWISDSSQHFDLSQLLTNSTIQDGSISNTSDSVLANWTGPVRMYLLDRKGINVSFDSSKTWKKISLPTDLNSSSITSVISRYNRVFIGSNDGLFYIGNIITDTLVRKYNFDSSSNLFYSNTFFSKPS